LAIDLGLHNSRTSRDLEIAQMTINSVIVGVASSPVGLYMYVRITTINVFKRVFRPTFWV